MNNKDNKSFIVEKVNKKAIFKRRMLKILILLISAVFFGIISSLTFLFVKEKYENRIDKKIEEGIERISIAIDEVESKEEIKEESSSTEETEAVVVEEIVQTALEEYKLDLVSLDTMYKSFADLALSLDYSIVSISNKNTEFDWFENEFEIKNKFAGVIIAKNDTKYFILAPSEYIDESRELSLVFRDDKEYAATVVGIDKLIGIAILSVDRNNLEDSTNAIIKEVNLGNSYKLKLGERVLALGAPANKIHSLAYSSISYIDKNISLVDMNVKQIYTDINVNKNLGNYIFNTSGELVGFANTIEDNRLLVLGISDFKSLIEAMINEQELVYLGIEGKDIEDNLKDLGIEKGIYLKRIVEDSPAYSAGLQVGDVLTHINGINIKSMIEYKNTLNNLKVGEEVNLKLKRYALGEYVDLEFNVDTVAR